jgi:hypothetical protein
MATPTVTVGRATTGNLGTERQVPLPGLGPSSNPSTTKSNPSPTVASPRRRAAFGTTASATAPATLPTSAIPPPASSSPKRCADPGKEFSIVGNTGKLPLYGQWLWKRRPALPHHHRGRARRALRLPGAKQQVSRRLIPNGCQSALKAIKANYEWICEFEKVVLMFDQDEPGREAAEEVRRDTPSRQSVRRRPRRVQGRERGPGRR